MSDRPINPDDILIANGFKIEAVVTHLTTPISLVFTNNGNMFIANAGITTGNGQVLKFTYGGLLLITENLESPVTGMNSYGEDIYVSHKDKITLVKPDGTKQPIITGLPSFGDHHTNRVAFGPNGKMYFGQGTATNSGVVGLDNGWKSTHPYFHDYPGGTIQLKGLNFKTDNPFTLSPDDQSQTGAFSPFGVRTSTDQHIPGIIKSSGSILRANLDGSHLERFAWGLRNPFYLKFDSQHRLFAANHGMDARGSRPIANSPDEFHLIQPRRWYGWPDYSGGYPITSSQFKPKQGPQPTFLFSRHPMIPPKPIATFTPHSAIMGFDFNRHSWFGPIGDVYIAEFGSHIEHSHEGCPSSVGHRVSRINLPTGKIIPFAMNKSGYAASKTGSGGFERPIDVVFGPDQAMYVVDMGMQNSKGQFIKQTGVVWRITKV